MSQTHTPSHARGEISALLAWFERQPHLKPNPSNNLAFNKLVSIARKNHPADHTYQILHELNASGDLARLHALCAEGETELEYAWSHRLQQSADVAGTLSTFPYLPEYQRLLAAEIGLLHHAVPHPRKVLFVGSGPLPISAWLMASQHNLHVDMVDTDAHAHHCAQSWLRHLPGHASLSCLHTDIRDLHAFTGYQAVFLAAMVGSTEAHKHAILRHLAAHMVPGQALLARSADGMRQLLYPTLNFPRSVPFKVLKTFRPQDDVINSTILAIRT